MLPEKTAINKKTATNMIIPIKRGNIKLIKINLIIHKIFEKILTYITNLVKDN